MKIATRPIASSFLLVERLETSSKGPGCLYIDMKTTRKAIGQKPETTSTKTDRRVKTVLARSPKSDLAT